MSVFPTTLPPPALSTLKESPPANTKRTNMDKGPEKVRRITSANTRPLNFQLRLTPAEVAILDEFFVDTTYSGSTTFDYTHPRTQEVVTARFTSEPSYSEQEGTIYNVDISLEIMP
jgi:hypothetical protein